MWRMQRNRYLSSLPLPVIIKKYLAKKFDTKIFPAISLEVVRIFVTLQRQNISFDYPGTRGRWTFEVSRQEQDSTITTPFKSHLRVAFYFYQALFSDISKFFRRKFWWFRKDCVTLQQRMQKKYSYGRRNKRKIY